MVTPWNVHMFMATIVTTALWQGWCIEWKVNGKHFCADNVMRWDQAIFCVSCCWENLPLPPPPSSCEMFAINSVENFSSLFTENRNHLYALRTRQESLRSSKPLTSSVFIWSSHLLKNVFQFLNLKRVFIWRTIEHLCNLKINRSTDMLERIRFFSSLC